MPRESWSHYYKGKLSDSEPKKTPPKSEPDTNRGFSEIPHTPEPEEWVDEGVHEEETRPHERTRAFGNIFEDLLTDPELVGMDDTAKKIKLKEFLRNIKYEAQGSDYDRVKAVTDKGEPTPWHTNTNWNSAKKPYRAAWENLRTWANERHIWNEKDKTEFIKETGGKKDWGLYDTTRNIGLNIAVGGLYGVGYAIIAPWKGFELALKQVLPHFLEDTKTTNKMMENMFGKEKEKRGKGKERKEEWNKAKEYDVRRKVKEMEQDYLITTEGYITDQKIESLLTSPEYTTATGEERTRLDTEITDARNGLYQKAWRRMRTHWIKERMWNQEDEKKFRTELGYTAETKIEQVRKDFLTRSEWNELKSIREEKRKKETSQEKQTKDSQKYNELDQEIKEAAINIKEILDKSISRFETGSWPFDEEGKQKSRRERRSYEDSVADTESDEETGEDGEV